MQRKLSTWPWRLFDEEIPSIASSGSLAFVVRSRNLGLNGMGMSERETGREKRDNGMVTIVHLRSYIYALFCNAREVKYRCATRGCTMARSIAEWKATRYREGLETNTNNRTVYTCRRVYSYMLPMYNISTHTTTAELIRLGFISAVSEVGHFLVNSCDIVERGAANTE